MKLQNMNGPDTMLTHVGPQVSV